MEPGVFDVDRWHAILSAERRDPDAEVVEEGLLERAEEFYGVRYPEAYKWTLLNYPGVELDSRHVDLGQSHDWIVSAMDPMFPPRLDWPAMVMRAEEEGLGEAAVAWEQRVFRHVFAEYWPDSLCFDFGFDAQNPPIVAYDWDGSWEDDAGSSVWGGKIRFICDSFVDLIELPVGEGGPPGPRGPKQRRVQEWLDWRLEFMDPAWDVWAAGNSTRERSLAQDRSRRR